MKFVPFEESLEALRDASEKSKLKEKVFLSDALSRVLATDIVATFNSPAYPTSAMDGYAIKHEDLSLGKIKILGDNPAGSDVKDEVVGGVCIKTFTGSLMPKGSDTLIPIELVEVEDGYIVIKEEVNFGQNVREVGENFKEGEVLIEAGSKLGFADIGVLASLNISQVEVFTKPTVGVLSTGSEILDVGDIQTNEAQIRSSNQFVLESLAKNEGAEVVRHSLIGDDKESIKEAMQNLLSRCDIVVTTGGVSVGDYDFVKTIIGEFEEVEYITKGVVLKPGQHIKIVKVGKKFIVALPGFPYSSTVTFILYVIPLIRELMGLSGELKYKNATLKNNFNKKTNKTEFHAGNLSIEDGEYMIDFSCKRKGTSAILTNMLGSVALVRVDIEDTELKKGDRVKILDMGDF